MQLAWGFLLTAGGKGPCCIIHSILPCKLAHMLPGSNCLLAVHQHGTELGRQENTGVDHLLLWSVAANTCQAPGVDRVMTELALVKSPAAAGQAGMWPEAVADRLRPLLHSNLQMAALAEDSQGHTLLMRAVASRDPELWAVLLKLNRTLIYQILCLLCQLSFDSWESASSAAKIRVTKRECERMAHEGDIDQHIYDC